ncbi:hypothetical protein [Salinicoccus roseus]|uniref:Two component regulator three Y domain-containing protein n=1 Tax=Salinicoccus roseus TaxID=45670 RepID=A0A265E5M3_9STAP|nr:hypothetical protein [Salinicoccus roseus]OZT76897.1 hypothetical protein CFN03_07400 [Salinicoccus roseus]
MFRKAAKKTAQSGAKLDIKRHEHAYGGKRHKIGYLEYRDQSSSHLIVVLSGFNGRETAGAPAKYNYMRTLQDIQINKLFIKDEVDNVPVYYLGTDNTTSYLDDVCSLVEEKLAAMGVDREQLIIAGSSKGGTGALMIGLRLGAGHIIAGANQLDVGSYLDSLNADLRKLLLERIMGDDGPEAVGALDRKVRELILSPEVSGSLYFHAGNKDAHYYQHMVPMLRHFDENDVLYELDLRSYTGHDNVKYYFPEFFVRKVKEIIVRTYLETPEITPSGDGTAIKVKVANPVEGADWAVYAYGKAKQPHKVMYDVQEDITVPVPYDELRMIKVFLRVNGEKKQVKEFKK